MARARVYRHDLRCPYCGSNWPPKDGRSRGKQTCRCRGCRHRFPETARRQALDMYAGGTGITPAGRVPGVRTATVFSWVKKSPPVPGTDGADDPAQGGAKPWTGNGQAFAPGDFLR